MVPVSHQTIDLQLRLTYNLTKPVRNRRNISDLQKSSAAGVWERVCKVKDPKLGVPTTFKGLCKRQ